jgi:hypothetical protein
MAEQQSLNRLKLRDDEAFADLRPYMRMAVAPNGVTIGDLSFVCAQSQWSSALLTPTTVAGPPVIATFAADQVANLFQVAQGQTGQGFTNALTRSETSWLDADGKMPANQVFIATRAWFQVFARSTADTTATGAVLSPLASVAAASAIAQQFSWFVNVGDGIERPYGTLLDYAGGAPVYAPANPSQLPSSAGAVQLGQPGDQFGRQLRIPLIFPPNVPVRIQARSGGAFDVALAANPTNIVIKQTLYGFLCTSPVG